MRRIAASVLLLFTLSLAACATQPAERHSYLQVKCPACGYQFDAQGRE